MITAVPRPLADEVADSLARIHETVECELVQGTTHRNQADTKFLAQLRLRGSIASAHRSAVDALGQFLVDVLVERNHCGITLRQFEQRHYT